MRITKLICDCGCGEEVGPFGFELSQNSFARLDNPGGGVVTLDRDLHFVDLTHLAKILPKMLEVSVGLKKSLEKAPRVHGRFVNKECDFLYID